MGEPTSSLTDIPTASGITCLRYISKSGLQKDILRTMKLINHKNHIDPSQLDTIMHAKAPYARMGVTHTCLSTHTHFYYGLLIT